MVSGESAAKALSRKGPPTGVHALGGDLLSRGARLLEPQIRVPTRAPRMKCPFEVAWGPSGVLFLG